MKQLSRDETNRLNQAMIALDENQCTMYTCLDDYTSKYITVNIHWMDKSVESVRLNRDTMLMDNGKELWTL